jgi:uncharacterized repeat protein (TIGR03806 family)
MKKSLFLALAVLAGVPGGSPAQPKSYPDDPDLPPGFSDTVIATGLTGATALAVAPDGRVFVCEQTGALRVLKDDVLLPAPFLTVAVDSYWERGLIGVAFDPDFAKNQYVYICYVAPAPYPHHRVSRFTARGDVAVPGSEVVLLEGDDQTKLGGSVPAGHQGGGLHFGKDGKLYIGIGEQTAASPAQRLDSLLGKLLRINPDGSIPEDNPFYHQATGKYRAIWALGLRNPFAFAVQPGTGRIFINDVGNSRLEEINEGVAGGNYGWPENEGPTPDPKYRSPLFAYDRNAGKSITGGTFYNPPVQQFPPHYAGKYFFMDYMDHWIWVLDPDDPKAVSVFATGLAGPVDLRVAPDGSLYYLNRKAWVKDDRFRPQTSSVHKICYTAHSGKPVPHLTAQPDAVTAADGQVVTFRVTATGAAPLSYRWQRDGVPIPGARSPSYTLPSVRAADDGAQFRCVVSNALGNTRSRRATLRVLPLREPDRPAHVVPGLDFACYEGSWDALPDFASLKPVQTGVVGHFERAAGVRKGDVGFTFQGFLDVAADGAYTFTLTADGPSKLFIGSTEVAGTGRSRAPREASGSIALKAGKHAFRLLCGPGNRQSLPRVSHSGPDQARQPLPAAVLFRSDPAVPAVPTITPGGGTFTGPVWVRLATTPAGATIRYTTDDTEPGTGSAVYRQPVRLDRSATVRAKAFPGDSRDGSAVATATFQVTGTAPYGLPQRELVTTLNVPPAPGDLPPLLSQTGVFRSLADLTPNPGLIPYQVNSPLWSDGADKLRWIALPGDSRIGFAPTGEWKFPSGTVFVKHFEMADESNPQRRWRLETRLLVVDHTGNGYGVTYKWRPDQREADLLADGLTEEVAVQTAAGPRRLKWSYPSRSDCLTCHTANAGFVLGANTRQLNGEFTYPSGVTDNQLRTWNHLGMFQPAVPEADLSQLGKLAAVTDPAASLEHRVRSYLDSNCAQCHRPGGARGLFDARFDIPLSGQNLVNGPLAAADLGVRNAKVVAPQDLDRSMVYQRMGRRQDVFNMPPLASHEVDAAALAVLAEWIQSLPLPPPEAPKPQPRPPGGAKADGASAGRFLRLYWYEPGLEHGNPVSNRRFRVNAPEAVLHPSYGQRSETKSSGMLQIRMEADLRRLAGAELYLELWGGHPGTANRRVTVNGRTTYHLPVAGDDRQCTHLYPLVPLKVTDLVNGYNALQFACDQGTASWGHFIVDNACLRAVLPNDHPDLAQAGLAAFRATVRATPAAGETLGLTLAAPEASLAAVAAVEFQGYYQGYDENGDGQTTDWHGFTKHRQPVAVLGTADRPPFTATWDLSLLPDQKNLAVRAVVHFKDQPNLIYVTPATRGLRTPARPGTRVAVYPSKDLPRPFWSRASRKRSCTIDLDVNPGQIEQAELHVVAWDGGAGTVKDYFTLNGRAFPVAGGGKHDVIYSRLTVDPGLLRKGTNHLELLSDTEHHGIEILLPGPALVVRSRQGP